MSLSDAQGYNAGQHGAYVRTMKSSGGIIELLEHADPPITEIALEVGYSSSQVLARAFAKRKRMSPSDYRRVVGRYPGRVSISPGAAPVLDARG